MWEHLLQNIITDGVGSTNWPLAVLCGNVADLDPSSVTASSPFTQHVTTEHKSYLSQWEHRNIDEIVHCQVINEALKSAICLVTLSARREVSVVAVIDFVKRYSATY